MKVLNNIKMCFFWEDYWHNEMTAKAFGDKSFIKAYSKDENLYTPWREGKMYIWDADRPKRYQLKYDEINKHKKIMKYLNISENYLHKLCNRFRSPHLWKKIKNRWHLRHTANKDGTDD